MKCFMLLLFLTASLFALGQKPIPTTENFTMEGKVKKEMTVLLADLSSYKSYSIDSIVITNHLSERRSTLKNVKGVLLKDILGKIEIDSENPKLLSEFYFICIASDNYKVVFSWNEIFSNDLGKSIYILNGNDGKPPFALDNRIALISQHDYTTGRRYVKGLQKIVIERVK